MSIEEEPSSLAPDFDLDDSPAERFDEVFGSHHRALLRPRPHPAFVEQFAALIRNSPCTSTTGGADYPDARYYLDRAIPPPGALPTGTFAPQIDQLPGVRRCLTATNLAELAANTHLLPPGTIVQVFAIVTRTGTRQYVFNQPPPNGAIVKITGAASGGGKYNGRVLTGASTATASPNLAMPEGLIVPASDNALICNEEEDGQSGHRLAIPCYAIGQIAGTSNGLTIVIIRGALGAQSSPTNLGDGTGGAVSPDSTSWSRASSATPLNVWVQTRTVWDSTGGTLYAYLRQFTFDARGLLIFVSGENQITVDVPTPCS